MQNGVLANGDVGRPTHVSSPNNGLKVFPMVPRDGSTLPGRDLENASVYSSCSLLDDHLHVLARHWRQDPQRRLLYITHWQHLGAHTTLRS